MSTLRPWLAPIGIFLLLVAAVAWLFRQRLASGDDYPAYSSLRTDPLGTRVLYEALEQIPGIRVSRDFHPLAEARPEPAVVILAGLPWQAGQRLPARQLAALDAAVARGARLVLAFRADQAPEEGSLFDQPEEQSPAPEKKPAKSAPAESRHHQPKVEVELAKAWGVKLAHRLSPFHLAKALQSPPSTPGLPPELAWHGGLIFEPAQDAGWKVIYRRVGQPVLIEKIVGRGSIVMLADAYLLSNEGLQRDRATPLLTWLLAGHRQVTFLEGANGVLEDNGIGALARRYGLGGAFALSGLLGLLYAWRRLVAFRPDHESADQAPATLHYEPAAGLTNLLRRSLAADGLAACVAEWRKSQPRTERSQAAVRRVDAAWQAQNPKDSAVNLYNALVHALKNK